MKRLFIGLLTSLVLVGCGGTPSTFDQETFNHDIETALSLKTVNELSKVNVNKYYYTENTSYVYVAQIEWKDTKLNPFHSILIPSTYEAHIEDKVLPSLGYTSTLILNNVKDVETNMYSGFNLSFKTTIIPEDFSALLYVSGSIEGEEEPYEEVIKLSSFNLITK